MQNGKLILQLSSFRRKTWEKPKKKFSYVYVYVFINVLNVYPFVKINEVLVITFKI